MHHCRMFPPGPPTVAVSTNSKGQIVVTLTPPTSTGGAGVSGCCLLKGPRSGCTDPGMAFRHSACPLACSACRRDCSHPHVPSGGDAIRAAWRSHPHPHWKAAEGQAASAGLPSRGRRPEAWPRKVQVSGCCAGRGSKSDCDASADAAQHRAADVVA